MDVNKLIEDPPMLHRDSSGNPASWHLDEPVLRYIAQSVTEASTTLETGAGISTVLFALKYTNHTCIVPDEVLADRIRRYCRAHDIADDRIDFVIARSEVALPRHEGVKLNLVLIDGRHAFPSPFIDWYYSSLHMEVGALLVIDDVHLWTGGELVNFLIREPEWRLQEKWSRSAVFVKLHDGGHDKGWASQPYLRTKSRIGILQERIRYGQKLLRGGNIRALARHLFRSSDG